MNLVSTTVNLFNSYRLFNFISIDTSLFYIGLYLNTTAKILPLLKTKREKKCNKATSRTRQVLVKKRSVCKWPMPAMHPFSVRWPFNILWQCTTQQVLVGELDNALGFCCELLLFFETMDILQNIIIFWNGFIKSRYVMKFLLHRLNPQLIETHD